MNFFKKPTPEGECVSFHFNLINDSSLFIQQFIDPFNFIDNNNIIITQFYLIDIAELIRQQNRDLRRAQRDVERSRTDLERQEKQLELDIKKAAKQGNKQVCAVLAKQLVQLRKQKTRMYTAGSQIGSIGAQSKV